MIIPMNCSIHINLSTEANRADPEQMLLNAAVLCLHCLLTESLLNFE